MSTTSQEATRSAPASLAQVSALFFASGAVALVYEIVWLKRFAQVWGSSALALGSVVAAFLAGLGLGARFLAPRADRAARPLLGYALAELAIAVCAFLVPFELSLLSSLSASLYPSLGDSPALLFLVRLALCLATLGPPTFLMGVTLPLLVRHLRLCGDALGASTARMYALNGMGAAAGSWLAGFHLLPLFGMRITGYIALAANLLVAGVAWSAGQVAPGSSAPEPPSTAAAGRTPLGARLAAALAGGAALVLQMVWARELSVLVGGSTYAYAAVLAVFLLGISAGSYAFQRLAPSDAALPRWVAGCVLLLALTTLLGIALTPDLARWVAATNEARSSGFFNALVCMGASAVLELVPTLCMGFLFPAVVQATRAGFGDSARAVGTVQAWNTAGGVLCALCTAPLLLGRFGALALVLAALVGYAGVPLVLHRGRAACAAVLGLVVLAGLLFERDPRDTNLGLFLYGADSYPAGEERVETLFFQEGPTSNVLVARETHPGTQSTITLRVNGKIDGSDITDMSTQLASGYLPLALRPQASEVLIIGFGTGTTAGACLGFADVNVDCCEIEPGILAASPWFHHVNRAPEESPRYRTILDDGRNYVRGTDARYDLVISEPSNPWIAGTANLFTVEFFEAVQERLEPGGLLLQWLQKYALSHDEYALVLASLRSVYAHVAIALIDTDDTLLLASDAPIVPARAVIELAEARFAGNARAQEDLSSVFELEDVRSFVLAHLLLDDAGLERMLPRATTRALHTDDNLRLEFDAPAYLFQSGPMRRGIQLEIDIQLYQRLIAGWGWTPSQAAALDAWSRTYQELGVGQAAQLFRDLRLSYDD